MATWKQFQRASWEIGAGDFEDIADHWNDYKDMRAGRGITLYGGIWKPSSDLEWSYEFMERGTSPMILKELGESPPELLPMPDKDKLIARWPEHISYDRYEDGTPVDKPPGYKQWTLDDIMKFSKVISLQVDGNVFRLFVDGKEMGFAQRTTDFGGPKDLYIARMRIWEEGKGYGTRFTEELVQYARDKGFKSVMFLAEKPQSVRIAEKLEFETVGHLGETPLMKKSIGGNPGHSNPGNPGKEPMPKSEITNLEFYKEPKMMGDHWAIGLVDHYFDQREKILGYKGASAVDREALAFYESLLIAPTRGFWWHNTDRKHLDTILWFLRRLKVGITREQEKDLFADFYRKLAYYRRFFLSTKDLLEALDKRWGTAGKVLPVLIDTTQFKFGSVAWQDAMTHNISSKIKAGMPLDDFERAFVPTQLEHILRLKIEQGTPLTEKERIIWDWLERKVSPITPEEFKDLPFEKKMEIAEKADRGEATEEELTALKKWLREPGFMEAVRINRRIDALLSEAPISLEGDTDKQILRFGILAELDAINLYEQMASMTVNEHIRKVLLDIAKEEKTHIGEFQALLLTEDEEQKRELKAGREEVRRIVQGKLTKDCQTITRKVLAEYREQGYTPEAINKGLCEDFAMKVIEEMGGYSETLYELSTESFTDDTYINVDRLGKYGTLPEDVNPETFIPPTHVWIYCDGQHYDAQSPEGVDNFFDLRLFKIFISMYHFGPRRLNRKIDAMVVQGKGIILNLDDIRDTTKGFHKDVFRRIRESKAVRELGKVMAETDLDIMNDDDLMTFLNRMPMPPEWGAIIRPDGDFAKLTGTIGGKPLAIYWDIGNQIGVMHYHPWEVTYGEGVTLKEFVPYPKLSGEDIPDILANINTHGIENFRYEAVFTDDKITIYDLGNYTPDKWKEIVEHAQKKVKEHPGLDMELSMLGHVEVEPILVFIFHGARDLGYIDWRTIPLKGKVNLEELFPEGRSANPDKTKDMGSYTIERYTIERLGGGNYRIKGKKLSGYEVGIGDYLVTTTDLYIEDDGNQWHLTGHGGRMSPDYAQIWLPKSLVTIRWDYGLHSKSEDFIRIRITIPNWLLDKGIKSYRASKKNPKGMKIYDFLSDMEKELETEGRLANNRREVCGEPCPKHPASRCHVACLPDELYKELKFKSALPVSDCRDPHIHSHLLPTKDGRLLAHKWGKGIDKYVAADSPKETSLKLITEEEARELVKENADWKTPNPHEPIPVYRVSLDTPKGQMNIDVPTSQGPDAAARRALWAIVAKFGFEPDEVTVMASTPVEVAEERDEKWRPVIVLSEQGTPVTMMVPARIPTELEAEIYKGIFDKIKNPEHWKLPTEPVYTEDRTNAQVIRDAIEYFHGGGEITQLDDKFKVWSKGYFFYVGGKLHVGNSGKEKIEVCLDCTRKHLLAARALLKEVLEGTRKSGYPTMRERLKVEEIEEQIQEVEKHPLRGEAPSKDVKERLLDLHDKAYKTRKKLEKTKIGYPHEEIRVHGDIRDIEEILGRVEEMLGDTYEMIAMGETSMERIEVSFKEENGVQPAHGPPTARSQSLTINARCATCCDHDGICHIDVDNLDGWDGEHLARIMPVLREITAPAVRELDKLNKHFGTNVDIRFWSLDDLKNAGLKTNYMGFVAHSNPSTMFLLPENIYNPLDSVRTVRHEFQHALDLSGGCPLCTSHQREKRARQFEDVTFPIAGLQRTEKVAELVITPYSKLMKKTKDQIFQTLKETHPNADYDFWIKGGTIGYRGAATTIKELVDMGIDGISISLRDATITWNADRGYSIHALREDIFAGKVKEQGGEAINARIDAQIDAQPFFALHETPDYWTVIFTPTGTWMGRWNKSEAEEYAKRRNTLFSTPEARRSEFVGRRVGIYDASGNLVGTKEILAVNENAHKAYPQRYVAGTHVALLDDGTEIVASGVALVSMTLPSTYVRPIDGQPIRVHAPTIITSLLNQTANILQIAAEKLPEETIYFPPKEAGEKQPIKLEGRVSLKDIAGLTKYLADMLAVSGRIDAQVTWEERSEAWEEEFQRAPFLFTRDRDERIKWVIGILSDVQEVIYRKDFETANAWLNKAKYHLIKLGKVEGRELIMIPQRKLSAVLPDYESDAVMEMEEIQRDFELGRIPDFWFNQEKARVEGKLDTILDLMALAQKGKIAGKRVSAKEINIMIDGQVEEYPFKEEKKKVATNIIRHSSEGKPFGSTQMILTSGVLTTIPRDEVDHMWDDYLNDRAAIVEYHVNDKRVWIIDDGMVLTMLFPEEY